MQTIEMERAEVLVTGLLEAVQWIFARRNWLAIRIEFAEPVPEENLLGRSCEAVRAGKGVPACFPLKIAGFLLELVLKRTDRAAVQQIVTG